MCIRDRFIDCLSSKELGKAFGRENITHCALASGGLTKRIVEDAQRLKGLRIIKDQNSSSNFGLGSSMFLS